VGTPAHEKLAVLAGICPEPDTEEDDCRIVYFSGFCGIDGRKPGIHALFLLITRQQKAISAFPETKIKRTFFCFQ
jgi:hypothetical protein